MDGYAGVAGLIGHEGIMATPGLGEVVAVQTAVERMVEYGQIHSDYLLAVQQVMTERSSVAKLMYGH
eukprot:9580167-Prorocentrum_lima.AAC.1